MLNSIRPLEQQH